MELKGAVVIVTGASSGIGAATAKLAAAEGATVVLAARRAERLRTLAATMPGSSAVPTDMRDPEAINRLVQAAIRRHGRVDVLVNNAGQGLHVPLEQVKLDDLKAITELNFYGPLLAMQAVLPIMRAQGRGVIVNVSSGTTKMVLPGVGAYSATKAALNMMSEVARREFAPDGIVVSLVQPSVTTTEFHKNLRAGARAGGFASGRVEPHTAEQVAEAIIAIIRSGDAEASLVPTMVRGE
jgi:NADP-dependent 3-hydroxy acid dehydrogenase YdfG